MNEIFTLVRRFGILPVSQAVALTLSTITFAWLARELGPEQYARFAVVLLFFSAISLVTDLSPQGFVLVQGLNPGILRASRRVARISAFTGASALAVALFALGNAVPVSPPDLIEVSLLCLTLMAQAYTQVPRAEMVVTGRYRSMAVNDIAGTVAGCVAAILFAGSDLSDYALVVQLATTVICKFVITATLARGSVPTRQHESRSGTNLLEAVAFGIRVIPLNLASYLSRALDSGLLPQLVSATAAAGYARSYQVVVVPISQLQLSLGSVVVEKISKAKRSSFNGSNDASLKLWTWLQRIALFSGLVIVLSSSLIEVLLFGPRWPLVNVTLSAMATCLPGVAAAAFGAWSTQVDGGRVRTLLHFIAVLSTPVAVVVTASLSDFHGALISLVVIGGLLQPLALALIHRQSIRINTTKIFLVQLCQWLLVASAFFLVASNSGFWGRQV